MEERRSCIDDENLLKACSTNFAAAAKATKEKEKLSIVKKAENMKREWRKRRGIDRNQKKPDKSYRWNF